MNKRLQASERRHKRFARGLADGLFFLCLLGLVSSGVMAAPARVDEAHGEVDMRGVGAL